MSTMQSLPRRRIFALTKRAWLQQRSTALWLALIIGGVSGVLPFVTAGGMNGVTELSDLIPSLATGMVSVRDADGELLTLTSYMLLMMPVFLGVLVAMIATLTLPGVVADDVSGGGIEVLLASPVPRRSLFSAYLAAGLTLTAASWIVALVGFAVTATATATILGVSVTPTVPFIAALIVLSLSMGVWSAVATLFGALLYPGSLESKAGMNGGPIRLLALAPSLLTVPSVLFLAEWVLPALGGVLLLTVLATFLMIRLTARGFRSARVLGS
ncbi:hypothetical protein [Microbacterium aurantiacum]|uniref:hypothetical protein n=1 Tax=Microbacterium aurantiacum TaxID=162393 RepID=UPI004036EC6D